MEDPEPAGYFGCPVCRTFLGSVYPAHSVYLLHMIDDHWDIVSDIHETTGDENARTQFAVKLAARLLSVRQN